MGIVWEAYHWGSHYWGSLKLPLIWKMMCCCICSCVMLCVCVFFSIVVFKKKVEFEGKILLWRGMTTGIKYQDLCLLKIKRGRGLLGLCCFLGV